MRTWFMIALLAAVALSGCAGEEAPVTATDDAPEAPEVDDTNTTVEDTPETNETVEETEEEVENLVPVLTVTADVVNGTAPLLVHFTIEVEDDSDNLTWAFLVDGNETLTGTEFPATFNHTFEAGNWTAGFTVDDGEHVVEDELLIHVATAVAPVEEIVFSGEIVGVGLGCADPNDPSTLIFQGAHDFAVTPDLWGMPYVLEPESARVSWWLGEELDDPIAAGGNSGDVPADTTSGHVCFDATGDLFNVGLPAEWTLTVYKSA